MENRLLHEPEFNFDSFRANLDSWKAAGAETINIDWSTGPGPTIVYFPSGNRTFGVTWKAPVAATRYSETYADFIEYKLAPRLVELVQGHGLQALVRCVDQQPILVMRQRRREIESAEHALAGQV